MTLKNLVREAPLYRSLDFIKNSIQLLVWIARDRPNPPPNVVKQKIVRELARRFGITTFVETGTYLGDMVHSVYQMFERTYSIEIDEGLYESARRRFRNAASIRIMKGDSTKVLSQIFIECAKPAIFWLDAHFSGGCTGKGKYNTPILQEIGVILDRRVDGDVILIDDARDFNGLNDYPSIAYMQDLFKKLRPAAVFEVKDDVIRIHPQERSGSPTIRFGDGLATSGA